MEFEWDPRKAAKNLRKHKVSFAEAAMVFSAPLSATASDPDHSEEEDRYIIMNPNDCPSAGIAGHGDLFYTVDNIWEGEE